MSELDNNINRLLREAERLFLTNYDRVENRLLRFYMKALEDIKSEYKNTLETQRIFNINELRKNKRLKALENQIAVIIAQLENEIKNNLTEEIRSNILDSYYRTGFIVETQTGIDFQFGKLPADAINYLIKDNTWVDLLETRHSYLKGKLKQVLETNLRTKVRFDIASELVRGTPVTKIAEMIKDKYDVNPYWKVTKDTKQEMEFATSRAKMIAFTETHKAFSMGRSVGINKAMIAGKKLGIKVNRTWHHYAEPHPRILHVAMDGHEPESDGYYHINGVLLLAPGIVVGGDEKKAAGEVVNCKCTEFFNIANLNKVPEKYKNAIQSKTFEDWKQEKGIK